jgi:hypothetical protein
MSYCTETFRATEAAYFSKSFEEEFFNPSRHTTQDLMTTMDMQVVSMLQPFEMPDCLPDPNEHSLLNFSKQPRDDALYLPPFRGFKDFDFLESSHDNDDLLVQQFLSQTKEKNEFDFACYNGLDQTPTKLGNPEKTPSTRKETPVVWEESMTTPTRCNTDEKPKKSKVISRTVPRLTCKPISKAHKSSFDYRLLLDSPRQPRESVERTPATVPSQTVRCEYCGRQFTKTQSLGGHISKKHPGKSEQYALKQQKRADNEHDREMRQKAKEFFSLRTKKDPAAFRQKITEIKKLFIALDDCPSADERARLTDALQLIVNNVVGHKPRN